MDNFSHYYTFAPPQSTVTDRGSRVLVYRTIRNLVVLEDTTQYGQIPLKFVLSANLTGIVPASCMDVDIKLVVDMVAGYGYDGITSRIDTSNEIMEFVPCLPPCKQNTPLEFERSYTI